MPASQLSPRELEVLALAAQGQTNTQIAQSLGIAVKTVERHLNYTYLKLGLVHRECDVRVCAVLWFLSQTTPKTPIVGFPE